LEWGDPSKPGILFVHGNGAHAKWFHFLAPFFTRDYHAVAPHLSGMGDSGWRGKYSRGIYADELMAVCEHANLGPKPIIAGHSFGGFVTLAASHKYQDKLGGIVMVDDVVRPKALHEEWFKDRPKTRPTRVYASYEDARARFRLAPPQPCANQYITDYIGSQSLTETDEGWTWKFDPSLFYGFELGDDLEEMFTTMDIPVAAIMGQYSWNSSKDRLAPMQAMRPDAPFITIPDANHHLLLDQPVAFASALLMLLATPPFRQ
jgi:pimeloyl-ACP methyl ester carboxylesterase